GAILSVDLDDADVVPADEPLPPAVGGVQEDKGTHAHSGAPAAGPPCAGNRSQYFGLPFLPRLIARSLPRLPPPRGGLGRGLLRAAALFRFATRTARKSLDGNA